MKYNNTITFARSLLALSSLFTLLFNNVSYFRTTKIQENYFNFFSFFDYEKLYIPYYSSIIFLMIIISGYYPRVLCIIQAWISFSIFNSIIVPEGGDQINYLLNLFLIPICLFDKRKNGWINEYTLASNNILINTNIKCALFIIKLQMSLLYFHAAIGKIYQEQWYQGSAIYYWVNHSIFGANDFIYFFLEFIVTNKYLVTFLCWGIILIEISLFVSLFLKQKYKYYIFVVGILFHFLIVLIFGLTTFFLAMAGGLILYLFNINVDLQANYRLLKAAILSHFPLKEYN